MAAAGWTRHRPPASRERGVGTLCDAPAAGLDSRPRVAGGDGGVDSSRAAPQLVLGLGSCLGGDTDAAVGGQRGPAGQDQELMAGRRQQPLQREGQRQGQEDGRGEGHAAAA